MAKTPDILRAIVADKRHQVNELKKTMQISQLRSQALDQPPARGFEKRIRTQVEARRLAVIAECKKASPSKGIIRPDYCVDEIAASYAAGGATCLSVLTDTKYFSGSSAHLLTARAICDLPILRKDFIIDPCQVYESRVCGADCILLIAAVLDETQLLELGQLAGELGMDVLIEVHSNAELQTALRLPYGLVGINNRNLHTFETDCQTSVRLRPQVPSDRIVVTESGIHTQDDVALMAGNGIYAFLVGESLMRARDPGLQLKSLFSFDRQQLREAD